MKPKMCPIRSADALVNHCVKEKCEKWVELFDEKHLDGYDPFVGCVDGLSNTQKGYWARYRAKAQGN
ncbi:MAG: hypothetical protein GY700_06600 [Propionibacteriaceae bacterium]|nr:hypothetical protein [Propionibacteriaceae bacterium]